ncbi:hypothetical protein HOH67_00175 [Candidatus Peregrinibacteria bacterium]|jgi:hypothetical protein|nr:hypothetical protein [Candidatus Peregrinibacteria bacterium]MBT5823532.1 hypothetical protein [Candidatus Peregrinibacteria bacterium]
MARNCKNFGFSKPFNERHVFFEMDRELLTERLTPQQTSKDKRKNYTPEQADLMEDIDTAAIAISTDHAEAALRKLDDILEQGRMSADERTAAIQAIMAGKEVRTSDNNELIISKTDVDHINTVFGSVEKMLSIHEAKFLKVAFLVKNGNRLLPDNVWDEFKEGDEYKIDFETDFEEKNAKTFTKKYDLHEMLPNDVTKVHLHTAEGIPYDLVRNSKNGRFYNADDTNKRISVYQGDKVKILERADGKKHSLSEKQRIANALDSKIVAAPHNSEELGEAYIRNRRYEERARRRADTAGTIALQEGEKMLKGGRKERMHSDLRALSLDKEGWEEKMESMDYGDQALAQLRVLRKIAGLNSEVEMWNKIRKKRMAQNTISFNEISRAVFGKDPDKIIRRFRDPKITPIGSPEHKTYLDFVIASYRLLEAVPDMVYIADSEGIATYEAAPSDWELSPEGENIKTVLDQIFPKSDDNPTSKRKLFEGYSKDREVNMQNLDRKYKNIDDYLNKAMSSKSANEQLYRKFVNFDGSADPEAFMKELNRLLDLGVLDAKIIAPELLLAYQTGDLDIHQIENDELSASEVALIRLGMAHGQSQIIMDNQEATDKYERARIQDILSSEAYGKEARIAINSIYEQTGGTLGADELTEIRKNYTKAEQDADDVRAQAIGRVKEMDLGTFGIYFEHNKMNFFNHEIQLDENDPQPQNVQEACLLFLQKGGDLNDVNDLVNTQVTNQITKLSYTKSWKLWSDDKGNSMSLNTGLHGDPTNKSIGIHLGVGGMKSFGKNKRWRVGANVGGFIDTTGAGAGLQIPIEVDLGYYRTHTLNGFIGGSYDAARGTVIPTAVGFGLRRNLDAVSSKKAAEAWEADAEGTIRDAVEQYADSIEGEFTPEGRQQAIDQLMEYYKGEYSDRGVEEMKGLQWKGFDLGLLFNPLAGFGVFRFAIKGKIHSHFIRLDNPDMASIGDAQLAMAYAARNSLDPATVHQITISSGNLEINEEGEKVLSETRTEGVQVKQMKENFDKFAKTFADIGVHLTQTADNKIRLNVQGVSGVVNIFTDPDSGIETYIQNGHTFLNLEKTDHLTMRRVDEHYPYENFGGTQHANIYISNNIRVKNSNIEEASKSKIRYVKLPDAEPPTQTNATKVILSTEARADRIFSTIYNPDGTINKTTKEQIEALGITYITDYFDTAALEAQWTAHEAIRTALEANGTSEVLSADRKSELRDAAAAYVARTSSRQEFYTKLTSTEDTDYFTDLVDVVDDELDDPIESNLERTYVVQELLMQSRPDAPSNPARFKAHIEGWNKRALTAALQKDRLGEHKLDAATAGEVADKIMTYYASQLDLSEEGLPSTQIEQNSIVHTYISVETGDRGEFVEFIQHPDNERRSLVGLRDISNASSLASLIGISEVQAEAYIAAKTAEMAPMPENEPMKVVRSPLGLALLNVADILYGADAATKLAAIITDKPENLEEIGEPDSEKRKIWDKFFEHVNHLRSAGTLDVIPPDKSEAVKLSPRRVVSMGFIDECRNFTTAISEELDIELPVGALEGDAAATQAIQALQARKQVNFHLTGLAGAASFRKTNVHNFKTTPPPPEEPPDDTPPVEPAKAVTGIITPDFKGLGNTFNIDPEAAGNAQDTSDAPVESDNE